MDDANRTLPHEDPPPEKTLPATTPMENPTWGGAVRRPFSHRSNAPRCHPCPLWGVGCEKTCRRL